MPYKNIGRFGFNDLSRDLYNLSSLKFIGVSRDKRCIRLLPKGSKLLQQTGYTIDSGKKRVFKGSALVRRRLEISDIMLTCLRAGIDVFQDDADSLQNQPVFYPAFSLRDDGTNLLNVSNCVGFGHWGGRAYMIQYVSSESVGMCLDNEFRLMHNLMPVFDSTRNTPSAMVFAGLNYEQIYGQICDTTPSKRHGVKGFHDFWDVYQKSDIPVHLLSCNEPGALQLAVMSQPEYNAKLARAAFRDALTPYDAEIPEADGSVDGRPLVVAVDMNIRRIARVCETARKLGRTEVIVAALKEQVEPFYTTILSKKGIATPRIIPRELLGKAFPEGISLCGMDKSPVYGSDGELIYA